MDEVLEEDDLEKEGSGNEELTVENLNRMNDAFAKFIFANEKRKQLTLDFVNSFFGFEGTGQIQDFKFSDRELDPDRKNGKGVVLDVVGESSDGTHVNVEIQLEQFDDMDRRTLYYWSRLYVRRLQKGGDYSELNRTVTLNILDYKLFGEWPYYHSCFAVLNTKELSHALTKDLEIHFVELPKLKNTNRTNTRHLERWLRYLSPKTTMEERRRLAMEDANINTAMEAEKEFVKDPLCITAYEQHQKYLRDKRARESFLRKQEERRLREATEKATKKGMEKGMAQGIAQGMAQAEKEMIMALHASGMSVEEIAMRLKREMAEIQQILK
ncbi:MAG: Rpn family recombination-promoting nuclease/putative transposase [Acidaminococcaceae bacterium]|nr:Rpn family recombination-promoting nuclease/putative transposase [Acidaminococcaceae bacterium]